MTRRKILAVLVLPLLLSVLACRAAPAPAPPEPPAPAPPGPEFSGDAAWRHLQALVEIGPRVPDTPGSEAARVYLASALARLGLPVRAVRQKLEDRGDGEPLEIVDLIAVQPGESSDLVLLAAHYDTRRFTGFRFVGANDGASGPALLLELARVLQREPLPYTVWFVFLDAEEPQVAGQPEEEALFGSRLLVKWIEQSEELRRVRLAVFFDQVADADLTIARDPRSHRAYRDAFFTAAREQGREEAFPFDAGFDSFTMGHVVLADAGVRRVVGIADPVYGGEERPGLYWHTPEDTPERCAPESLEAVGRVAAAGLHQIAARLRELDRFSRGGAAVPDDGNRKPGGS